MVQLLYMEDVPLTSTFTSSRAPLFVFILLVVLLVLGSSWYFFSQRVTIPSLVEYSEQEANAFKKAEVTESTFAAGSYEAYIQQLDESIASSDISSDVKNQLLYNKAIMLLDAHETATAKRIANGEAAASIFKQLYAVSADSLEAKHLKQAVVQGYLLRFNEGVFAPKNTRTLPEPYNAPYLELANSLKVSPSVDSVEYKRLMQLAFLAHIQLSYDPVIMELQNDTTFISNRMYTVATYMASFGVSMSSDEKAVMMERLSRDIQAYPKSSTFFFKDTNHTQLVADFYYAYAYSVYVHNGGSKEIAQASMITENYDTARKNVNVTGEFAALHSSTGQYINTFYLAELVNEKATATNIALKDALLQEMNMYADNAQGKELVTRFYGFLNGRGAWHSVKKPLVKLAGTDKAYGVYLKKLGVTLK